MKKIVMLALILASTFLVACTKNIGPTKTTNTTTTINTVNSIGDVNTSTLDTSSSVTTASPSSTTLSTSSSQVHEESILIDHNCIDIDFIPESAIITAKNNLKVWYSHTSHGSQITVGMESLNAFKETTLYSFGTSGVAGNLYYHDNYGPDLGAVNWDTQTRTYLTSNPTVNVVMWSWCGQLSLPTTNVNDYLTKMSTLESEYPNVTFVYMTGHLDGTGEGGTLNTNNNLIRTYCQNNGKVLYDFADIESYNPDGDYFLDKYSNDAAQYSSTNSSNSLDRNWATDWQTANPNAYYNCGHLANQHTYPIVINMKAYAAWYMFARIAGWNPNA